MYFRVCVLLNRLAHCYYVSSVMLADITGEWYKFVAALQDIRMHDVCMILIPTLYFDEQN